MLRILILHYPLFFKHLKKEESYRPNIIVFLQPTSPFRKAHHIDGGIEKIEHCDTVQGACKVVEHPFFMMEKKEGDLYEPYLKIKNRHLRRQDVPQLFSLNAYLAIAKINY